MLLKAKEVKQMLKPLRLLLFDHMQPDSFPSQSFSPARTAQLSPLSASGRSCWLTSSHWWVTVSHSWQIQVIIKCSGAVNSMVRNGTERAWETQWGSLRGKPPLWNRKSFLFSEHHPSCCGKRQERNLLLLNRLLHREWLWSSSCPQ